MSSQTGMEIVIILLGILVIQMFVLIRGIRNQSNIIAELSVKVQDHLDGVEIIKHPVARKLI